MVNAAWRAPSFQPSGAVWLEPALTTSTLKRPAVTVLLCLVLAELPLLSACGTALQGKADDATSDDDDDIEDEDDGGDQADGHDADDPGDDDDEDPPSNSPPRVSGVSISPSSVYVDGEAYCTAAVDDPDGDSTTVSYTWRNETRGTRLGSSRTVELRPDEIMPGETLSCTVQAEDPSGATASQKTSVEPVCGLADLDSLGDINATITVHFRPWTTDELQPGWGGTPWDWDGQIPDEVFDLANDLSLILTLVSAIYPAPEVLTAQETLDQLIEIGYLIDSTAPVLLEETVPPDADIFPYMVDDDGYVYPFWDQEDGGLRWQDSYEVELTVEQLDLAAYSLFALDLEDVDLVIDDNMGDFLDHEDNPLMLSWMLFAEGAYCTSTFYNPTDYAQSSEVAYVPSSILYMAINVY